jgi:hypothetical protein
MMQKLIYLVLILVCGTGAFAESPLELRDTCKNGLKALDVADNMHASVQQMMTRQQDTGHCIGYINAVADDLESIGGLCLPAGVSNRTFAEQYIGFAEHYPGHFDLAYGMVRLMLQERFPCKK